MVFAIVWQKRALAVGAVLAATTLSVAGAAAAAGQHSPGDRGGRGAHTGASATLRQKYSYAAVQALDGAGHVLGASPATKVISFAASLPR